MPDGQGTLAQLLPRKPGTSQPNPDRRPLRETNPIMASLQDFLGGVTGLQDALVPESSTATVLGAGLSAMLPLAAIKTLGRGAKAAKAVTIPETVVKDYRGIHKAPTEGASLADLTGAGTIYPDDVYSVNGMQYYGTGDRALDRPMFELANRMKGNPDAEVTVYRAVPIDAPDDIQAGDWVTPNRKYAENHGEGWLKGEHKIVSKKVKAGEIFTEGNSIHEWGYSPKSQPLPSAKSVEPIKAYHGSPHDFDKFSLSKIGTGEGAQAYGHGLYFAENPEVAQSYKTAGVTGDVLTVRKGDQVLRDTDIDDVGLQAIKYLERGANDAGQFKHNTAHYALKRAENQPQAVKDRIKEWADAKVGYEKPPSRMYEVGIHASPDEFLDWDLPLSQQSEKVRKALEQTGAAKKLSENDRAAREAFGDAYVDDWTTGMKAGDAYREIGDPVKAAEALKAAGIKGIRYLDQGSRNSAMISPPRETTNLRGGPAWEVDSPTGTRMFTDKPSADAFFKQVSKENERTSNFVVFDDEIIDIRKKYGVSLPVALAMKAALDEHRHQQAQQTPTVTQR